VSEVYRYKTRERIWVSEGARLVRDAKTGKPLYYEGSVREITETVKRLKLEEFYQKLFNQVPGGLFQIVHASDGTFSLPFVSPGFRHILGIEPGEERFASDELLDMIDAEQRMSFLAALRRSGRELERWDCEFQARDAQGTQKWLRITATPERTPEGTVWHGYMTDCSLRKKHEMAIEKLAYRDPLTDLPNRRVLLDRLGNATRKCARKDCRGALLFLDLDNFKELNDRHGHDVGDAFLRIVADAQTCVAEPAASWPAWEATNSSCWWKDAGAT
jgi:GGDEF domain-containing protein